MSGVNHRCAHGVGVVHSQALAIKPRFHHNAIGCFCHHHDSLIKVLVYRYNEITIRSTEYLFIISGLCCELIDTLIPANTKSPCYIVYASTLTNQIGTTAVPGFKDRMAVSLNDP